MLWTEAPAGMVSISPETPLQYKHLLENARFSFSSECFFRGTIVTSSSTSLASIISKQSGVADHL